jgi:arginase
MVSVLGIPFDANSSFMRGPALAPPIIRKAFHSDSANYFTEFGTDLKDHPGWRDHGDLIFDDTDPHKTIVRNVTEQLASASKMFLLGGDHSITYPIIKGFFTRYPDLTIVHVDAHPDLYDNFENNPHSHASPFARIMENGLAKRLIQVGIRTMNTHNREQAKKYGVEVVEMKDWYDKGMNLKIAGPAYLSFDLDAIDPAFAPGLSHHEPGGFTMREALSIIQKLEAKFVGCDLVEFNPNRDINGVTAMVAAKLFKEMLDLLLRSDR